VAEDMPRVTIYTDGGADPNPGPGGWGVVLIHESSGRVKELSGGEDYTTNNRMELTAALRALEALTTRCEVELHADSAYVVQGMTRWVDKWAADGWVRGKRKKSVENADLWRGLMQKAGEHAVTWRWVKGHAGDRYNERADQLATREIRRLQAAYAAENPDAEIYLVVSARPGFGLWAASVRHHDEEFLLRGRDDESTANRLTIIAAAEALSALPPDSDLTVHIYTLSDYLRNGATQWMKAWKRRDWLTKGGEPVKNQDAWRWLDDEMSARRVDWPPVKDDPTEQFAFEDVARRAQEAFEEEARREETYDD
jgi:ribonuclease HI